MDMLESKHRKTGGSKRRLLLQFTVEGNGLQQVAHSDYLRIVATSVARAISKDSISYKLKGNAPFRRERAASSAGIYSISRGWHFFQSKM